MTEATNRRNTITQHKNERCYVEAGDCRSYLPLVGDNTVNMVLTDPPYFTHKMGNEWDHKSIQQRAVNTRGVVGGMPKGSKFDRQQGRDLYQFLRPIADEWLRILKPGGFALVMSLARNTHHVAMALDDAGFEIRDMMAWHYKQGQAKAFAQDQFVRRMKISDGEKQSILDSLGGRKTPQLKPEIEPIVVAQVPKDGTFINNWLTHGVGLIDTQNTVVAPGSFPGQLVSVPKSGKKDGHMTVKPVDLFRHLIRIYCPPGEDSIVLDPFAGTGTAGVAAVVEGRGFYGYELDADMAMSANARVNNSKLL